MGCLLVLFAWVSPRLLLVFLWLFTDRLSFAFDSWFMGLVGFIVLPYTTAFYALAYAPIAGVTGIGWLFVAFGVLLDIGSYSGAGRTAQSRYRTA